jgi:hypothetical protein
MSSPPRGFLQFNGLSPDGSSTAERFVIAKDAILADFRETRNRSKHLEGFLGRFIQDMSIEIPCPPGKVFAVYVRAARARDGQRIVDSWEWIEADPNRRDFPVGHDTRYGSQLWSRD